MSKRYRMRKDITIDQLVKLKREGAKVRKLIWGLSVREYGLVYSVDGYYRVVTDADPDEIRRRLKETKKANPTKTQKDKRAVERDQALRMLPEIEEIFSRGKTNFLLEQTHAAAADFRAVRHMLKFVIRVADYGDWVE